MMQESREEVALLPRDHHASWQSKHQQMRKLLKIDDTSARYNGPFHGVSGAVAAAAAAADNIACLTDCVGWIGIWD